MCNEHLAAFTAERTPLGEGAERLMSPWAACTVWLLGTRVNEFLCGHVFICLLCSWTALLSNVQMRTHTRHVIVPLDAFCSLPCLTSWPQNPPLLGAGRVLQSSRDLLDWRGGLVSSVLEPEVDCISLLRNKIKHYTSAV